MLIRESTRETCKTCGSTTKVHEAAHGCDWCRKVIDLQKKGVEYDEVTVFLNESDSRSTRYMLCSVDCVVAWLRAFKPPKDFYFISMPLLSGAKKFQAFQKHLTGANQKRRNRR